MAELKFFFDYRSPYAYLAHTQLRGCGAQIRYFPFDIRALMEKVGNVPTSVICKAKNRYVQADLRRWAAHYKVPFQRHPDILEIDFNRLLRATLCASELAPVGEVVTALFSAVWGEPEPLKTPSDVTAIVERCGRHQPSLAASMDEAAWEAALERVTTEAAYLGIFGAPSIVVGDELFFGNDRLDFVRIALERTS